MEQNKDYARYMSLNLIIAFPDTARLASRIHKLSHVERQLEDTFQQVGHREFMNTAGHLRGRIGSVDLSPAGLSLDPRRES